MEKVDLQALSRKSKANLDKKKDALIRELKSKKHVQKKIKELNITDKELEENLGEFITFDEDVELCKGCPSLGECKKKVIGTQIDLKRDEDGDIIKQIKFCKYKQRDYFLKKNYLIKDFDEDLLMANIKDINFSPKREELENEILDFWSLKKKEGFYVYGRSGTGKSFPFIALLNSLIIKRDATCAFIDSKKFVNDIKATFNQPQSQLDEIMNKTKEPDYLVIDDFGEEKQSSWVRDEIFSEIIGYRNKKNKTTFITSAYSLDELENIYTFSKSANKKDVKKEKFIDRIKIACPKIIEVG